MVGVWEAGITPKKLLLDRSVLLLGLAGFVEGVEGASVEVASMIVVAVVVDTEVEETDLVEVVDDSLEELRRVRLQDLVAEVVEEEVTVVVAVVVAMEVGMAAAEVDVMTAMTRADVLGPTVNHWEVVIVAAVAVGIAIAIIVQEATMGQAVTTSHVRGATIVSDRGQLRLRQCCIPRCRRSTAFCTLFYYSFRFHDIASGALEKIRTKSRL